MIGGLGVGGGPGGGLGGSLEDPGGLKKIQEDPGWRSPRRNLGGRRERTRRSLDRAVRNQEGTEGGDPRRRPKEGRTQGGLGPRG